LTIVKKYLGIILLTLLGLCLRLIFIDKPDGLWNDEYVSWYIANTPLFIEFIKGVISQCHMPLYYLYLKSLIAVFGNSDIFLRFTSLIPGVIAIPIMYYVGLQNDKKTAYYCATVTSISAFLVYYSQEVRFYSLLFLFSALNVLYTIKILKKFVKKDLVIYLITNGLILFTHTIGFVYVFFNLLLVSIKLYKEFKKQILSLWACVGLFLLAVSPLLIKIFTTKSFAQWWGHYSISKLGFLFTDWFSPVITNLTNAPDKFLYMPKLAIFMLIPTMIAIFGIINALKKNKLNIILFLISVSVILILTIAAILGKLVFISKYSIEVYPILIYLACFGLSSIENKKFRTILISFYCLLSLGFIIFYPYSAPKMHRAEGHKIPMEMIKHANLKKGDYIILQYYPKERFEKYFDFSDYNVISINKGNFPYYLSENSDYNEAFINGKYQYRAVFRKSGNKRLSKVLSNELSLQKNSSVVLIILDSVSFYSPDNFEKIIGNSALYYRTPFLFLVFSYLKKETFEYFVKNLAVTQIERKGMWTLVKFTKLNN